MKSPETATDDIITAVSEIIANDGVVFVTRAKKQMAKQARELLADGVDPDIVLVAAVASYYRGQPGIMHLLAVDIMTAKAGKHIAPKEWRDGINARKA